MLQVKIKVWQRKARIFGVVTAAVAAMTLLTVVEMLIFPQMRYSGLRLEECLGRSNDESGKG
jgi:hypothetical protein